MRTIPYNCGCARPHAGEAASRRRTSGAPVPRILAAAAALLLAAGAEAAAGSKPEFSETVFRLGGKVDRRVRFDLDRDGFEDLVFFRGRLALVFIQKKGEGFQRWPDQVFAVRRDAVMCDFALLGSAKAPSLVLASETGLYCHPISGSRISKESKKLAECRTSLGYPGESDLLCRDFVFDLDGDGKEEAVVPLEDSYALFGQDESGGFGRFATLACSPSVTARLPDGTALGELNLAAKYPLPVAGDWNGDGKTDFVVRNQGNLWVYLQRGSRGFSPGPDAVVDTALDSKGKKKAGRFSFGIETPVMVADLNNDGVLDLVKPKPMEGATLVFLRQRGRTDLGEPGLVARVDGWPLGAFSPDLDGDGMPDLVVGHVNKIGVLGAIKIFLTKSVSLHAAFFMNRKGFSPEPDGKMSIEIALRFATTAEGFRAGTTALVNFDGDFDGDGRRDLLVKTGFMRLEIFRGREDGVFDAKPFAAVEIPDSEPYMWVFPDVADLNRDGISDIIVHYRDWEEKMDSIALKLSTGRK